MVEVPAIDLHCYLIPRGQMYKRPEVPSGRLSVLGFTANYFTSSPTRRECVCSSYFRSRP